MLEAEKNQSLKFLTSTETILSIAVNGQKRAVQPNTLPLCSLMVTSTVSLPVRDNSPY